MTRDTVYLPEIVKSPITKPTPVKETQGTPQIIKVITKDGKTDTLYQPVDTSEILAQYHVIRDYDTSYQFEKGSVQVKNTVHMNAIQKQQVIANFPTTVITNTVTQAEKRRNKFFLGIDGYGRTDQILSGGGVSLMYQSKKDRTYEVGTLLLQDQNLMFRAGMKFLISFRK